MVSGGGHSINNASRRLSQRSRAPGVTVCSPQHNTPSQWFVSQVHTPKTSYQAQRILLLYTSSITPSGWFYMSRTPRMQSTGIQQHLRMFQSYTCCWQITVICFCVLRNGNFINTRGYWLGFGFKNRDRGQCYGWSALWECRLFLLSCGIKMRCTCTKAKLRMCEGLKTPFRFKSPTPPP